jgi:anti-anti-sigma regulatory factor
VIRNHPSETPRVELREISGHTTVVALIGEHDLSTKARLLEQFARARMAPIVIVDLTPCTFIDSTIVAALLAFRRSRPRQRVELVLPPRDSDAHRALYLLATPALLPTYETLEGALAEAQPAPANV